MKISVVTKEELPIIQELAQIIWPATYDAILSKEQFSYMMEMMYSIDSLQKQLANGKVFLLIGDANKELGFASYELNFDASNATKIHKLYVLPTMQGKGIGKILIEHIENIAVKAANDCLVLTVNRFNKAKDFYLKSGFQVITEKQIDIGNNYIMDDYIMEKKF
jgi:GNAT superfamily N-acetyltransferase